MTTLYAAIGDDWGTASDPTKFKIPDIRESTLVGAGQSDNDYNVITNPNGIHAHDVYALGEFKDDQFQGHIHSIQNGYDGEDTNSAERGNAVHGYSINSTAPKMLNNHGTPRYGTVTHGKQMGTNFIIKY